MKQFTWEQVRRLRKRAKEDAAILDLLDEGIRPVRAHYRIPDTGVATWGGFFACPKHSVVLEFDISDPKRYRCPADGEVFTGEPYEGAWWRLLNSANCVACQHAALRHMLTGAAEDLALARNILVDYASRYPGYEVHGGIPYNHPGKANAQTLCDAQWLKGLATAYDIIRDALHEEDRALVERDLFRCGADFLMTQRTDQLHNHECVVSAAIGVIGILLEDEGYLRFALDTPYGLKYQLAHGTLEDGFWFEGTPSYHFYAMQQFIEYERFARENGAYSFFGDPKFLKALKFPMRLIQPDGMLPMLGDAGNNYRGFAGAEYLYEYAYAQTGDPDFARLLRLAYENGPRLNLHAFFDGVDALPEVDPLPAADYHAGAGGASGLTTLHGPDDRFLLVKHSPFGGEHDHYDRLALHFLAFGRYILPDVGTTQYGAPLHYAYFKNTASHNTVCLDGQNQPPANCAVRAYAREPGMVMLDAETCWDGRFAPLDSAVIRQWSDEAYEGARFRRHITWYEDCFVDCFDVESPKAHDMDWTIHVRGTRLPDAHMKPYAPVWAQDGPGQYLHDVRVWAGESDMAHAVWDCGEGVRLSIYARRGAKAMYDALGPDNPSVSDLSYWIERAHGRTARFVHVICAYREGAPVLAEVTPVEEGLLLRKADGRVYEYTLPARL